MNADSLPDKTEWRRRLRAGLKSVSQTQKDADSASARDLLRRQPVWQNAQAILFYVPMGLELDLTPLLEEALKAGKVVALPRFIGETGTYQPFGVSDFGRDCARGKFGLAEPGAHCSAIPLKRLDLVLAPGVGFDVAGRRLGRGRGYYDRLLAEFAGAKCGVAFDQQVVARIPAERHDVTMNYILTPTRWLEITRHFAVES
jgi:5-formyltetrahydrofolate cyclo-ligase